MKRIISKIMAILTLISAGRQFPDVTLQTPERTAMPTPEQISQSKAIPKPKATI